uniref:Uncharacterized protein n=1 Tax=Globisporangium ultimum (strain ATCC 200006 / CBS 805.95 / DAOM BR144) TaxID=431595 RepID=K3WR22_GLOUD
MATILALQPALINVSDHSQGMEPAMTALQLCVWHNHTAAVAWLVDVGGANLEVANESGVTPLLLDIMRIGIQKMRLMPLLRLCHVDMSSRVEMARLQRSFAKDRSSYGDIDTSTLNVLLARGANVNHCSSDGDTALLLAVDEGLIRHTQILLESGADAHFRDTRGRTVLEIACEHGYMDIAQLLLNAAPTLFHVAGLSDRLLHIAVEYDARECVRFLLSSGVDVDWQDGEDGARAIHLACRLQNTELLRVLLGCKADPNVFCKVEAEKRESDDDGENRWVSPYHIVTLRHGYEQIDLLAEHGADINLCHP